MKENNFFSKYYFLALALSTYPVSLLFTSNIQNTRSVMFLIPLALVYCSATCIYFLFYIFRNKLAFKNYHLTTSICTIIFFVYGIYYDWLISCDTFIGILASHRLLLPITLLILLCVVYLINKVKVTSKAYKFVLVFLISFNVVPFLSLLNLSVFKAKEKAVITPILSNKFNNDNLPNIYYIILDGYGSDSSMKKVLNYDNTNFSKQLEDIGFKVQRRASSNYCRTVFSLSSTLNFNYIQNIIKTNINQENSNLLISDNLVSKLLKANGYTYYLFDSGFGLKNNYEKNEVLVESNEFSFLDNLYTTSDNDVLNSFINNSIICVSKNSFFINLSLKNYAGKVLNVFNRLPKIAKIVDKKFVFAHIISPHPPYLFDRDGNISEYGNYDPERHGKFNWNAKLYIEQLRFINVKTLIAVTEIIKNDKHDKIIIIQGDHGTRTLPETGKLDINQEWVDEEYSILNAIYISKDNESKRFIYNNWNYSSVNTFRLIFNEYFQSEFPLLKDNMYHAELKEPYVFKKINP